MSTATIELQARPAEAEAPRKGFLASVRATIATIRQASAERHRRQQMAQLHNAILRDLGISADEIPRVHASEDFTPRTWQG